MSKRSIWGIAALLLLVALAALVVVMRSESSAREGEQSASRQAAAQVPTPPRLLPPAPRAPPPPADQAPSAQPAAAAIDARPAAPASAAALTEAKLMEKLRQARSAGRHALAIQLAREGNRRFPDSALAPERESILIHSLADNEQRGEARGEAERMVNHYPDSDWVREIERFTGAHRHRNVRLNDAGEIEYY